MQIKFKERDGKHIYDFNHIDQRKSTTLSKHIWDLQQNGTTYDLTWSLLEMARLTTTQLASVGSQQCPVQI